MTLIDPLSPEESVNSSIIFSHINGLVPTRGVGQKKSFADAQLDREKAARRPQSLRLAESLFTEVSAIDAQSGTEFINSSSKIEAAYAAFDSMKLMISQMQSIAIAAASTGDPANRAIYAEQYDAVQDQVADLAKTSKLNINFLSEPVPEWRIDRIVQSVKNDMASVEKNPRYSEEDAPEFRLVVEANGEVQAMPFVEDATAIEEEQEFIEAYEGDDYGIGLKPSSAFNHFATRNDIADAIVNMNAVFTNVNAVIRRFNNEQSIVNLRDSITNSKMQIFQAGIMHY